MKKLLVVVAVAVFVVFAATSAMAMIVGSAHDLSAAGNYTGGSLSACQYCHTPHHAVTVAWGSSPPLWNRTMSQTLATDGATSFNLYGGGNTLLGTTVGQPGVNSKTCLSCHDGTIAINTVVNGNAGSTTITGPAGVVLGTGLMDPTAGGYIGSDLRDDHPVGVVYGGANATKAGLTLTSAVIGTSTNYNITYGGAATNWMIYGGDIGTGKVECGSCHDPHNYGSGNTLQSPFLRDNVASICTDCHSNK